MPKKKKTEEKDDQPEVISRKKIIYIEIDDEVTAIFDRIKAVKAKRVYIVAPKRSILFQSIVNLKILKRKSEDDDKTIYLITNDPNGIYLAQSLGIQVYDKSNNDGNPAIFSTEVTDEKLRITPLKASVNSIEDDAPTRLSEKKISISEILSSKKGRNKDVKISKITSSGGPQKPQKQKPKMVVVAPNKHALIGLFSFAMLIFLVIVYIALPGATVYITPSASVLEKSVNITLADYNQNRAELETNPHHMIASFELSTDVTDTVTHFSTGKEFADNGAHPSGNITIYNTTNNAWPLVAETRFQTDEGIVFRVKSPVTVPAATTAGPGTADVFVIADPVDANGVIVGERGNIEPSRFFLPGLQESSRSKIYAESTAPMTGGITDFKSFVTAEDIEAAKDRLAKELEKSAIEDLRLEVQQQTELTAEGVVFALLEGDNAVKMGEVRIEVPSDLENREVSEFTLTGTVNVIGVYYDRDEMLQILKDELLLKKSPQKELLRINEDSTSYRIFEWDNASGKIKLTANIKGIEQFEIDPEKENGARLLKKIRDHIVGQEVEIAEGYIQNLPEVNKVEIDTWPAWSPTLPGLPDNIDFEVREAIEPQ